jgi:predicted transcriptional regulator
VTGMGGNAARTLGQIVALAKQDLNQTEIGEKVGMSQGAVSNYVRRARALGMLPPTKSRHPAERTIQRLEGHAQRWHNRFTAEELAAIELLGEALNRIRCDDGW